VKGGEGGVCLSVYVRCACEWAGGQVIRVGIIIFTRALYRSVQDGDGAGVHIIAHYFAAELGSSSSNWIGLDWIPLPFLAKAIHHPPTS
jgi:hypothetical protein